MAIRTIPKRLEPKAKDDPRLTSDLELPWEFELAGAVIRGLISENIDMQDVWCELAEINRGLADHVALTVRRLKEITDECHFCGDRALDGRAGDDRVDEYAEIARLRLLGESCAEHGVYACVECTAFYRGSSEWREAFGACSKACTV